jgi:hypothetical protein
VKGCCVSALLIASLGLLVCGRVWAQVSDMRVVHVFVALADNEHQGIVPVSPKLGNGEDAERNLYWGSAYGVKTFFSRATDWQRIICGLKPKSEILERCVFKYRAANVYLVADAYRGMEIRQAILDFLDSAAGDGEDTIRIPSESGTVKLPTRGGANVVVYIGHDGLMDFQLVRFPVQKNRAHREAIVLACASKQFFANPVRASGAFPLLWTTGLMAPEAYTLKSALDGWIAGEGNELIRDRAAGAYDKYQNCGIRAAHRLLVSGW